MAKFLVTGANGYVGSWCVKMLLDAGHNVTGTVRDPSAPKCAFLRELDGASERLVLVKADLLQDSEAWRSVVRGCKIVLHTASPFVVENVPDGKEEEYFLQPAVQGTENVMTACVLEGVERVVLTSSVVSIGYGHGKDGDSDPMDASPGPDETSWTNVDGLNLPAEMYMKSKTVAEDKAWDVVKDTSVQLAVVNPVLVVGPFLSADTISGSMTVIRALLKREYPMVPSIPFHCCDVRDVAKMHLQAALSPDASGKRFMCCSTPVSVSLHQIAMALDAAGFDVPTGRMPNWFLWVLSWFDKKVGLVLPDLGKTKYVNPKNGSDLMEGQWIDYKKSMSDMAFSLKNLAGIGQLKQSCNRPY